MRKIIIILSGLFFLTSCAFAAQAETKMAPKKTQYRMEEVIGTITLINDKKDEITLKLNKGNNEERIFKVSKVTIPSLKVNEEVMVMFESGSNVATHVMATKKPNMVAKK